MRTEECQCEPDESGLWLETVCGVAGGRRIGGEESRERLVVVQSLAYRQ